MSAQLDPQYDYIGMEFIDTRRADVVRCCIVPPDVAFRISEEGGEEEENIVLLWRMDEYADAAEPPSRLRLHTIFAAFAQLYHRHVGRQGWVQLMVVRSKEKPQRPCSDLPAVNFRLWESAFNFVDGPFSLKEYEAESFGQELPSPEPPLTAADCMAARREWEEMLKARTEYLLAAIHDAESYEMLCFELKESFSYLAQMSCHSLDIMERMDRLRFMPWYAEVLRRVPGLNRSGLCLVGLESLGRYALYDYRPEEGRRFRYEAENDEHVTQGRLHPAQEGDERLPYDADKHLHLLPVPCGRQEYAPRIPQVPSCVFFKEDWI